MPRWAAPERQDGQWVLTNRHGLVVGRMPDGAIYFEQCYWPYLEGGRPRSAARGPGGDDLGGHAHAARPAGGRQLRRRRAGRRGPASCARRPTGRSSACSAATCWRSASSSTATTTSSCCWPATPQRANEFLDRLVEIHLANLEKYLALVGPFIDIILFGDDLGMQNGPQISPAMYRELFKPRHAAMWRRAKELADVKVMLHCCGGVRPLLDDLIDAGLDAINPVQISCAGMDAAGLKRDFGDRHDLLGRRLRHAQGPHVRHARARSATTSAGRSRSSAPAAASSSSRSTTSWPTSRRRT